MAHKVLSDLHYAKTDEWVRLEGDEAVVGISDYAQDTLSDIVYVELPSVGDTFDAGQPFGVVESVKAASDLYAPVAGEVVAVNQDIVDTPDAVNADAYANWLFKLQPTNAADVATLLDAAGYAAEIAQA